MPPRVGKTGIEYEELQGRAGSTDDGPMLCGTRSRQLTSSDLVLIVDFPKLPTEWLETVPGLRLLDHRVISFVSFVYRPDIPNRAKQVRG